MNFLSHNEPQKVGYVNRIELENQRPGADAWDIRATGKFGDDLTGQVKGYATACSVNHGGSIDIKVSVTPAQDLTIDVYRIGYYGGAGGRLVLSSGSLRGLDQPLRDVDLDTGLIDCGWATAWTLSTGADWLSGKYLAVLTNDAGFQNYVQFVVRDDDATSPVLVIEPVATYQAYNGYPTGFGKSFYDTSSSPDPTLTGAPRGVKVSFNRPYENSGFGGEALEARQTVAFARWAEANGYDVTYATSIDLHNGTLDLTRYRAVVFPGHDEYWSSEMYDAVERGRDAGTSMLFLSANNIYWAIRFEDSADKETDRTLVCYKDADLDPDTSAPTVLWHDRGRSEQRFLGAQYTGWMDIENDASFPMIVQSTDHWLWAGTGLADGDQIPRLIGGEGDRRVDDDPLPDGVVTLAESPYTAADGETSDVAQVTLHEEPNGAVIFDAGTYNWSRALSEPGFVDGRIQRAMTNLMERVLA
jgi:hypothetical protein